MFMETIHHVAIPTGTDKLAGTGAPLGQASLPLSFLIAIPATGSFFWERESK